MSAEVTGTEAARQLAGLRRVEPRQCIECGHAFEGLTTALYCGPTCQVRAYRRRRRARERGEPQAADEVGT